MLEDLDVPFRDASAAELVWELDAAPQPYLAQRWVRLPNGLRLELRLLGASHQVLVERPGGGPLWSELVSCRAGRPGNLPARVSAERPEGTYRFTSRVERLDDEALAVRAQELRARGAGPGGGHSLVGAFPGSPHAVTAVEATDTGWRTWHVYPQTGEVVTTETVLEVTLAGSTSRPAAVGAR